jgi:4,5-epoxidase
MADVPATDERLDARRIVARIEALLPVRTGDTGASVRDAVWTSVFRVRRRLAADYRRGRVLLAGDAAHVHSPIGGQGMNTGIGDAENLAWKLALVARGRADAGLLDTYAAERRPLAADVLSTTTANTRMLVGEGPVTRLIRDRVFVPLLNLPAVQRRATRTASQLDVSYRTGPLGGPRRAAGPRPGDRVPDRDCLRPDGTPTRLYAELGSGWVVLAPHGAPGAEAAAEAARDRLGERVTLLHPRAAEPGGTVLLVRPDGHAGGVGAAGADGLGRYLDAVLLGAGGGR